MALNITGIIPAKIKVLMSAVIENSDKCIDYRIMWRHSVNDHHVRVPRKMVLQYLCEVNPEGVRRRKAHRLVGDNTLLVVQIMFGMSTAMIS